MEPVYIIGVGMTQFGKFPEASSAKMGADAAWEAIRDAGIDPRRIQAATCGHVYQGMNMGQLALARLGLTGIPITNVENACASGSTSVRDAMISVGAGLYDVVLALGVEKLSGQFKGALTGNEDDIETMQGLTMPAQYALRARRHMMEFGTRSEHLAMVTVKNRKNAANNPMSQFKQTVTVDEVVSSRMIADPLHKFDCCPVSDGAAAVVLASQRVVNELGIKRPVRLAGTGLSSGAVRPEGPDMTFEHLTADAGRQAYEMSGCGPEDVNLAEVHDCFTIAEIMRIEGLGLCGKGEYWQRLERGYWDIGGKVPVNPSGGLIGKGHPLGATGVAQMVEITRQFRGLCGVRQIENPRVGLAHCRGGSVAGTEGAVCAVHILTV